jgi:hypothetical protein
VELEIWVEQVKHLSEDSVMAMEVLVLLQLQPFFSLEEEQEEDLSLCFPCVVD